MTIETALYIFGAALLPILGWGIHITWTILKISEENHRLLEMHEDPDNYGFGTGSTNKSLEETHRDMVECVKANTDAVKSLTHYIMWLAEQQTGKSPPPPM